jgi:hypothetical protein
MKIGGFLGNVVKTARPLGSKPGGVEKTLKSGAPRHPNNRNRKRDERQLEASTALQEILRTMR